MRKRTTVEPSRAAITTSASESATWKGTRNGARRRFPEPCAMKVPRTRLRRWCGWPSTPAPCRRAAYTAARTPLSRKVQQGPAAVESETSRLPGAQRVQNPRPGGPRERHADERAGKREHQALDKELPHQSCRAAPSAARIANSCCRAEARARNSPERFAQQISSTATTSICNRTSGSRVLRSQVAPALFVRSDNQPRLLARRAHVGNGRHHLIPQRGEDRGHLRARLRRLTPGFSRAKSSATAVRPVVQSGIRHSALPSNSSGRYISGCSVTSTPSNPSGATPTIVTL